MLKALNRIAWIASFGFGFVILMMFGIFFDVLDGGFGFDDDLFPIWLVLWFLFSALAKKFFLSRAFLQNAAPKQDKSYAADFQPELEKEEQTVSSSQPHSEAKKAAPEAKAETMSRTQQQEADERERARDEYLAEEQRESTNILVHQYGEKSSITKPIATEQQSAPEDKPRQKTGFELFIQDFFRENLLAKVGGIMLFLGVLFLLQLVYSMIGPVGKLMIGFLLGFGIFGIGVWVETKKLRQEALVLMGTGILINFLVILAGRYLIGSSFGQPAFLSEIVTFFLLICNTAFAITVALVYRSPILLLFSFVIAYVNPFLIGSTDVGTPYTLVGYSIAVSFGALVLSQKLRETDQASARSLAVIAFVGGNLLFLAAPYLGVSGWFLKLFAVMSLSLSMLFLAYHHRDHRELFAAFIGSYLVLFLIIASGAASLGTAFFGLEVVLGYIFSLIALLIAAAVILMHGFVITIFYLLFAPLIFLVLLMYLQFISIAFLVPIFLLCIVGYLLLFVVFSKNLQGILQYSFFLVLGGFMLLVASFLSPFLAMVDISDAQRAAAILSILIFFGTTYFFSLRKELANVYGLGTIASVLSLIPLLSWTQDGVSIGVVAVVIVTAMSAIFPLLNKTLRTGDVRNIIAGILVGALFGAGEMYAAGQEYFAGVAIGVGYLLMAIFYFAVSYVLYLQLESTIRQAEERQKEETKNLVYLLIGVSVSLFSLAVAFVFSKYGEIVSAVWLFEASVLFYFYWRLRDRKIYFAAIALMGIGVIKLMALLGLMQEKEFLSLIPLAVVMGSLVANLKLLSFEKSDLRVAHDVLHVLAIILLGILLMIIIPASGQGWSVLGIAAFALNLAYIYSRFYCGQLPKVFSFGLFLFFLIHIFALPQIYAQLQREDLLLLMPIQYLATAIIGGVIYFARSFQNSENSILYTIFAIYLFIITSQFVYYLFFENIFVVTIYWGLLAFLSSWYGIMNNRCFFRTLGLYIVSLTAAKILLYDVWVGLDDAVMRIVALMLTGGLMIGISILYTKKYGNNLRGEFDLKNLITFNGSDK